MKKLILLLPLVLALALAACAGYQTKILAPWMGASESELVARWGYPQASTDIVHVDADTKVYTYRSIRSNLLGTQRMPCAVSFTLRDGRVVAGRSVGDNCLRIARE